jgi:hypothetical protein
MDLFYFKQAAHIRHLYYITRYRRSSMRRFMFVFTGGSNTRVIRRKRGYAVEAQARAPFLTYFDASTVQESATARHEGEGTPLRLAG